MSVRQSFFLSIQIQIYNLSPTIISNNKNATLQGRDLKRAKLYDHPHGYHH